MNFKLFLNKIREKKRDWIYEVHDLWQSLSQHGQHVKVVNQQEIRFVGLRRSGNHGVLSWLQRQVKGKCYFLNNVETKISPFRCYHHHFPEGNYRDEAWGNFSLKDCLIYSFEDHDLVDIFHSHWERKHDIELGKSARRYDVLLLRDPFNLIASRLKKNYMSVKPANKTLIDLWIDSAREYLGETSYLIHNKIVINFNQWFTDIDYRRSLAESLGLEFTDEGIEYVSSYGGGSSFDGVDNKNQASKMKVGDRWQNFSTDERFLSLIRNDTLLTYSQKIFGDTPEIYRLVDKKMF